MKREILFKAICIETGKWVQGLLNQYQGQLFICVEIIEHPTFGDPGGTWIYKEHKVHPETVCQFTGKLDANKNKIFENDIVYHGENPLNKVVVVWNKRTCGFVLNTPNYQNEFTRMSGLGKLTITGNIHDK